MAYIKTNWTNNQPPAINATNLNKIEQGIYDAHEDVAVLTEALPTKANIDGYYDTLSVGLADNLIDRKGNGNEQSFTFRTSCGDDSIADDGSGIVQSIKGNTMVWNQKIKDFATDGISKTGGTTTINDGIATFTADAVGQQAYKTFTYISQHIYMFVTKIKTSTITDGVKLRCFSTDFQIQETTSWQLVREIKRANESGTASIGIIDRRTSGYDSIEIAYFEVINLTQMFGAGNEPSTVEEFKALFPLDYYEYNEGELISFNGTGLKTVGFNQMDSLGKVKAIKGLQYEVVGTKTGLAYSDGTEITLSNNLFTADRDDIVTVSGFSSNTCVHLTWSGYRNGEYEPYWTRLLNFPIAQYFPTGMKSAGTAYDELTSNKATTRIGAVDMGSLVYIVASSDTFYAIINDKNNGHRNVLCSKYVTSPLADIGNMQDKQVVGENGGKAVYIKDSAMSGYTTAQVKSAMNGVILYYEKAEPTEVTIDPPLDLTYKVADFGTEQSLPENTSVPTTTPLKAVIKYSDDYTRMLATLSKQYDTTDGLDGLLSALATMLGSALDGTVTITRGAYDSTNKKYAWTCTFTANE